MAEYQKSIVSYFDVLGFRSIVSNAKNPEDVARRLRALNRFSSPDGKVANLYGHTFTNFSDLVVRTVPIRPNLYPDGDGLLYWEIYDLIHVQAELTKEKVLVRGALTIGDIFVDGSITFGPALIRAYELESSVSIAPRVIIDPIVFALLEKYPALRGNPLPDEMQYLCRVLKRDRDGVWFIDYLRAFESEADSPKVYLEFLRAHRDLISEGLQGLKALDPVVSKLGWLKNYHNEWITSLNPENLAEVGSTAKELLVPDSFDAIIPSINEDPNAGI